MPIHREPITPIVENRKTVLSRDSLSELVQEMGAGLNRFVLSKHGFRERDRLHVTLVIRIDESAPEVAQDKVLS